MFDPFIIWVVYDHPTDYPDDYVARKFTVTHKDDKGTPTDEILVSKRLEDIREVMRFKRLIAIARFTVDDPKIIETWL